MRTVPGLLWVAVVWTLLSLWAQDGRGLYIAVFCLRLSPLQMIDWRRDESSVDPRP